MSSKEQEQVCSNLIEKVSSGQPLDAAEKAHMIECEECMTALVHHLDTAAAQDSSTTGTSPETRAHDRSEAQQALAHGTRVFQREFGLSLTKETTSL